jgi:hypothetical protein
MSENITKAVIDAADKNYTEFKAKLGPELETKLTAIMRKIVKEKEVSLFNKKEVE